jgi:glycosyltransferase involved in cell wall biosynthesis
LAQDYPTERLEIVVVDGVSEDGSAELARSLLDGGPNAWKVISNPERNTPAALNLGLEGARGEVILHMVAHGEIPHDYVQRAVAILSETGADCVGGPMETRGTTLVGRAIALSLGSPFGVGGVAYRTRRAYSGPVDTTLFGVYRRDSIDRVGGYDPAFLRNQDAEMNFRITRSGGRIWLDSSLRAVYYCRESLGDLWRQHYRTGMWKIHLLAKHRRMPAWRHYVPGAFVAALAVAALAVALGRPQPAVAILGTYGAILVGASAWAARGQARLWPFVAAAMLTLHLSYGTGSIVGAGQVLSRRTPQSRPAAPDDARRASKRV